MSKNNSKNNHHRNRNFFLVTAEFEDLAVLKYADDGGGENKKMKKPKLKLDRQLLHEHILKNLEEMRQYQETAAGGDGGGGYYDTFIIRGPFDRRYGTNRNLVMRPDTAAAIADAFREEASRRREWKTLQIWNCSLSEPMHWVLQELKAGGLFPEWKIGAMNGLDYAIIIEQYFRDNPALKHLQMFDSLLGDSLDFDGGRQLKQLLDTTSATAGTTRLKNLDLRTFAVDPKCVEQIVQGLKCNDSLESLTLQGINISSGGFPDSPLEALEGHPSLQTLDISSNNLSSSTIFALGKAMKNPACRIRKLDITASRSTEPMNNGARGERILDWLRTGLVVDALTGCQSLVKLSMSSKLEPSHESRLLSLVDTCPLLQEIDLSGGLAIRSPFWTLPESNQDGIFGFSNAHDNADAATYEKRKSFYRLILDKNPIMTGRSIISQYDKDLQELLLRYPALGEISSLQMGPFLMASLVSFSPRTNQLLAFNYAGRGQLSHRATPPALWPLVLQRVRRASRNGLYFLPRQDSAEESERCLAKLALSCQASVVFSLLQQDPLRVTLEACHSKASSPAELVSSIYKID